MLATFESFYFNFISNMAKTCYHVTLNWQKVSNNASTMAWLKIKKIYIKLQCYNDLLRTKSQHANLCKIKDW